MADSHQRVLVTGGSGLLGRAIVKYFKEHQWIVLGLAFSRARDGLVKVDLRNADEFKKTVLEFKPSVIIHSAAERAPDKVENEYEAARQINVAVSQQIAQIAADEDIQLIYLSTDYVFDGTNPPYKETDLPNPLNKYGQSKLDGEVATLETYPGACVLRVPVLYGQVEYVDESAVTCLFNNVLKTDKQSTVSDYEIRYPAHTEDIAAICFQLSQKLIENHSALNGIFHWSGKESYTKYGMIKAIAEAFNLSYSHITPDPNPSPGAPRPYNSQLDTSRLENLGISHHTSFQQGIKQCLGRFLPPS